MTARVIIIHDPSSNRPSDDVAHDAINSEINDEVVVRFIDSSGCRVSGCRVQASGVPEVAGYTENAGNRHD